MGNCQAQSEAYPPEDPSVRKGSSRFESFRESQSSKKRRQLFAEATGRSSATMSTRYSFVDNSKSFRTTDLTDFTAPEEFDTNSPVSSTEDTVRLGRSPHPELGAIRYQCNSLEEAKKEAIGFCKPILGFVVDIPGDTATGTQVFSHPLIVEAAESLFVTFRPRPRQNDKPSGLSSVVVYTPHGEYVTTVNEHLNVATLSRAMLRGLQLVGRNVPRYLALLEEEENGRIVITANNSIQRTDRKAVFGFSDCHAAEIEFGGLEGVLATRAGHIQSQPVLQVTYNARAISYSRLVSFALRQETATKIYYRSNEERIASKIELQRDHSYVEMVHWTVQTIQPDLTPKQALKGTQLRYVPMTDLQATRANRLVSTGVFNEAMHLLSPRQGMILMRSIQHHQPQVQLEHMDVPIARAWATLSEQI